MVSTSQQDERINDILDKLQKISTNCSKISNNDDKFNKEIKESFVEINTTLKNIIEYIRTRNRIFKFQYRKSSKEFI
ncbi:hypothetical protein O6R16_03330 [Candidatus Rickettsia tasmanensis]